MSTATGIGSHPGDDDQAYAAALRLVVDTLAEPPGIPYLPEVPGRGPHATTTGRGTAVWADLGADVQPAGWRLTGGGAGADQRRARSLLAQDLDGLEEATQGYTGRLKVQVAGPWTLAATVERPRGDRLLADHGARRDLSQALAEGLGTHVADLRRRVPGADLVVQLDEPSLPAVLAGRVPTASGWGRHRTVHPPEASDALGLACAAIVDAGAEPWVHVCAPDVPVGLLTGAGARGVLVDLAVAGPTAYEALAQVLDDGGTVGLGVVSSTEPATPDRPALEQVLRLLEMLGLDPEQHGPRVVVTPTCGLAGAGADHVRRALRACREAAADLP
ncbi:MAG: methionine synthase [Nocardioides sp.]|nr:methionine synthase [Nocardioides sp.]